MYGKLLVTVLAISNAVFLGIALTPHIHQSESALVLLHLTACAGNTFILAAFLRTFIPAASLTFAAGVFVEAAQVLVPGRTASLSDLVIDGLGVALGAMMYVSIHQTTERRRSIVRSRYQIRFSGRVSTDTESLYCVSAWSSDAEQDHWLCCRLNRAGFAGGSSS